MLLFQKDNSISIYLSQHHIEPIGLSHFTYDKYCKAFQKAGEYSFINNPEGLIEAWEYYAKKWAQYDNLVWQTGLRGKADRPVWKEAEPTDEELKNYTEYIHRALYCVEILGKPPRLPCGFALCGWRVSFLSG